MEKKVADKRRAYPGAEAVAAEAYPGAAAIAAAAAAAEEAYPDAEAIAAAAVAAAKAMAIVPSPVPISICGLREAQILAVKLAPGARVKVCSVAAKDAAALIILLSRQMVRSGWVVAFEDLRALEALALAYLLSSTAIAAHHPLVSENLDSTDNRGYLLALKDWSLLFEDAAGCVPSVGGFKFFAEARNVSKLARKVVVGALNGGRDPGWLRRRLEKMGKHLPALMNCTVDFPVTLEKMKAKEKGRKIKEGKRRERAEARVAAAIAADAAVAEIRKREAAVPLLPSTVPTEIWGLRSAHFLSVSLVAGSAVKVRAVMPMHAMALRIFLSSHTWIVSEGDLRGLDDVGACYQLLSTAVETHLPIFSTLTRQELAANTGYAVAFNDWVREFEVRVPCEKGSEFSRAAAEVCTGVRELLAEACNCSSRSEDWFGDKLSLLTKMMKVLMGTEVYFREVYFPAKAMPQQY